MILLFRSASQAKSFKVIISLCDEAAYDGLRTYDHIQQVQRESKSGFKCQISSTSGDAINVVLAAIGYNFRLLLRWLRLLLFRILTAIVGTSQLRFS
jgi:hypothetical protein